MFVARDGQRTQAREKSTWAAAALRRVVAATQQVAGPAITVGASARGRPMRGTSGWEGVGSRVAQQRALRLGRIPVVCPHGRGGPRLARGSQGRGTIMKN